jgi:aliphatic nitrilase
MDHTSASWPPSAPDRPSAVRVAAVHAAPAYLDRERSVDRACELIARAAGRGARLIAFPETFVPGYPNWIWTHTPRDGGALFRALYANSMPLPGEDAERIGAAARAAGAWVALGVSEREGGTLYNTVAWFDDTGALVARHRKLQPTHAERTIWGRGDGRDVVVVDAPFGRLGGLICSEHLMDLNRYALAALGEQIHVALWPALSAVPYDPGSVDFDDYSLLVARYHAVAAQVHVISVHSRIDEEIIERLGFAGRPEIVREGGGCTAIIDPEGRIVAGPHRDREEILYADLDPDATADAHRFFDTAGHYARHDVFSFGIDRRPQTPLTGG